MQMNGWLNQPSRWMSVLLITGILSALAMPQPCAGEFKGIRSSVFSLDLKDEPLGEVVKKVSAITGYQIMINPEWGGWPISARLQNVKIDLGLRQILSKLNHFIVFNEAEHRISIVIESSLNGERFRKESPAKAVDESPPGAVPSSAMNLSELIKSDDIQVIPPRNAGDAGVTQKELEETEARRPKVHPDNIEVIPPAEAGARGVTLKEIKAKREDQLLGALKNINLVPPAGFVPK
jgi:hypothetical protein